MSSTLISRRTVLRGMGTAVALPLLDSMMPRSIRAAASAQKPPARMAFLYVPNGMHMPDWTPDSEGSNFDIKPTLEPIAQFKDDMTMLSGLTLNGARALGDGGGDHARSVAAFLTGAHPKKTNGADINNGISVDQVAAEKIGDQTRLPSLELGLEQSAQAGNCDSGYSCVYTSNMCWRTPTSPVAKEVDPTAVFDRLFGSGKEFEEKQAKSKREQYKKSVLDLVREDANDLRRKLGSTDQRKLDEYLFAVRSVERQIAGADKLSGKEQGVPDFPRPAGVPEEFDKHLELMFSLMTLAFQTDSTRVITFMFTNAGSNRSYPQIDVGDGHHSLSHHGNNKEKQEQISKINRYHVSQLAYFLKKLSDVREGEGRLLDNCMVMYGSGIGDGNRHNHDDLPIVLFGKGGGTIKPGRHIRYEKETPLTNLYLSMLDRVGASVSNLGDSTGRLEHLDG